MRILLVSDHYPPFIGGVQRQTHMMAQAFMRRGHEPGVVTVWQDALPALEMPDGFPVWRVRQLRTLPVIRGRSRRRHQAPGPDPVSALQLRRVIRQFEPDIVHSSGWFAHAAALALLGSKIPHLISAREYGFICANASLLHKGDACSGPQLGKCVSCSQEYFGSPRGLYAVAAVYGSKPLLRRAAGVHSVSHYVDDLVVPNVFRRNTAGLIDEVIPSFRTEDREPVDQSLLEKLPAEPFILFVGALRRVKGVKTLFDAYSRMRNAPPLVLLGTFEDDTPWPIPEGAIAVGGTNSATVMAGWDRSLFGVMPSLWPEPFGSVVHEAMSRGKAVIGTVPGGHADIIEAGRSGLLVPSGNVERLLEAMTTLNENPDLRQRLESRARERAREFGADIVIPQFERLYERVLSSAR